MFQNRFGLHKSWPTTIFVLNLAVADLLYCTITVPLTALQFFDKGWRWGEFGCILAGIFKYGTMTAEWMSVALIAFSKCVNLIQPKIGKKLFTGRNGYIFIVSFWICTFLWYIIPVYVMQVDTIMEDEYGNLTRYVSLK